MIFLSRGCKSDLRKEVLRKATFSVIMLFTAVAKWNDYFSALLYLPKRSDLYPLQMVLREILITSTADFSSTSFQR